MLDRTIAPEAHQVQSMTLVEPQEYLLENGLRIFVFDAADQELIKAEFVFRNVFDQEENALKNSAMCALLKEGTATMSSAQIAEMVDYYGAYLVPEYSFDYTGLTLYTLGKHASNVLPVVWNVLNRATMPDDELLTYKRNSKQSLQISLEKNEFVARKTFYQELFGDNRYGRSATPDALDALKRSELLELYEKQIRPDNCTLFLAGHIDKSTLNEIFRLFGDEWSADYPKYDIAPPNMAKIKSDTVYISKTDSLQSAVRIGNRTITRVHKDYPALQFVNTLFGGYFGSRLMQNLREDKGYTYGISSSILSMQYTGLWTLQTQVAAESTRETLLEIQKELDILQQELASENEIKLVKNYLLGSMLGSLESIFSHADKFKAAYLFGMPLSYYKYYTEVIQSMDSQKIREIAQQYFNLDASLKVVVGEMSGANG